MAGSLTIEQLKGVPAAYDKYFTALASGKPEILELPEEFDARELAGVLDEALSDDDLLPRDINDILNSGKIGFTLLKFSKTGKPSWCAGTKLTGERYYPPEDNAKQYEGGYLSKDFA